MARVHLAFGGNVGDVEDTLRSALEEVSLLPGTRVVRVSSLYRTAPEGVTDQPEFLNGAAEVETDQAPGAFLEALLAIERRLGRTREVRWGPRTVDLDVVLWEDLVLHSADLEVPHPRMHERAFVLAPLAEIAPQARHPVLGRTVGELLEALGSAAGVRHAGRPAWAEGLEERGPRWG